MFNRSFQNHSTRAVREAGGGHKLAAEAYAGYHRRPKAPVKDCRAAKHNEHNVSRKPLKAQQLELFCQYIDEGIHAVKRGNSQSDPDRPLADILPPGFYED